MNSFTVPTRVSTGVAVLDRALGGGLLPGTLTVAVGATGIGKSQLGLHFAHAGVAQEGHRGVLFDLSVRGDPQSQPEYAQRMFGWQLDAADPDEPRDLARLFDLAAPLAEYLRVFGERGPTHADRQRQFEALTAWQVELVRKLDVALSFLYRHFCRGVRRVVIDGLDPTQAPRQSVQFELFEYVYQQILRKESDWVARDLLRQDFLAHAVQVAAAAYDHRQLAGLLLYTSPETMLDDLIARPLADADWLANANTVLYLGKTRQGNRLGRALYVAKHRGSALTDEIIPYTIDERGLSIA